MERKQINDVIWQFIMFLKKWNLFNSIEIIGGGKKYSDIVSESDQNYVVRNEVYITLNVENVSRTSFKSKKMPIFTVNYEGSTLGEFFTKKRYYVCFSKISKDAIHSIMKSEEITIGDICCFLGLDNLEKTEFQDHNEYKDMVKTLVEEMSNSTKEFLCCPKTVEMILDELDLLCEQNNIRIAPIDENFGVAWKKLN